jgi:hypothetical protein
VQKSNPTYRHFLIIGGRPFFFTPQSLARKRRQHYALGLGATLWRMATLLKRSRTQVDRLLDPKNDITLSSLQRAATMVGRRVVIETRNAAPIEFGKDICVKRKAAHSSTGQP